VDNIRIDLGKVGWGDVDWIGLPQDRNRWRWGLFVGNPVRKRPLGRPRRRWVDNIRIDLGKVE
jgi:hypothetical protein